MRTSGKNCIPARDEKTACAPTAQAGGNSRQQRSQLAGFMELAATDWGLPPCQLQLQQSVSCSTARREQEMLCAPATAPPMLTVWCAQQAGK